MKNPKLITTQELTDMGYHYEGLDPEGIHVETLHETMPDGMLKVAFLLRTSRPMIEDTSSPLLGVITITSEAYMALVNYRKAA